MKATCAVVLFCLGLLLPSAASAQTGVRPGLEAKPAIGEAARAAQGDPLYTETSYTVMLHSLARVKQPVVVDKDFTVTEQLVLEADLDQKGVTRFCTIDTEKKVMGVKSPRPVAFETFERSEDATKGRFRREVVFSGAAGGLLRLLYREFSDDFARPAFTQELSYDLPPGAPLTVNVKSARIEVTRTGNEGIEYRVLKGFDSDKSASANRKGFETRPWLHHDTKGTHERYGLTFL